MEGGKKMRTYCIKTDDKKHLVILEDISAIDLEE